MDETNSQYCYIHSSPGCPFRCCFCQQQKISATQHPPSISQVQEIIETALVTIPSESDVEVAFLAGLLPLTGTAPKRLSGVCPALSKEQKY